MTYECVRCLYIMAETYLSELQKNGYVLLTCEDVTIIDGLRVEYYRIYEHIKNADNENKIVWKEAGIDDEFMKTTLSSEFGGFSIRKFNNGRYDISPSSDFREINDILIKTQKVVSGDLIETYLNANSILFHGTGILPVSMVEEGGLWHRDSYELFRNLSCTKLPPYYVTCLIYLNDKNDNDAGTLLIRGSHLDARSVKEIASDHKDEDEFIVYPKNGQVLIFDGRLVHRGVKSNYTDLKLNNFRELVYITTYPFWYYEPNFC
jgi:hypothetical protein